MLTDIFTDILVQNYRIYINHYMNKDVQKFYSTRLLSIGSFLLNQPINIYMHIDA